MDRVCVIICIVIMAAALGLLVYCCVPSVEQPKAETLPTTAETTEYVTEPTETETPTTVATEPPVVLFDVPLDAELQLHIIDEAEEHGIDPAIVMAMAYRESTYRTDAIGDNGDSYGLLQVQPRWHYERMQKLGCTDLLDPYQNVTVAIDYLAEQINHYGGDLAKGLTAYNRGSFNGTVTQYAKTVLAHAEQINNERGQN